MLVGHVAVGLAAKRITPRVSLGTTVLAALLPDLRGVDVYIYGVHAIGKDIPYWLSLRDFYTAYFKESGANLQVFSMLRDTPDFNQVR